MSRAKPWRCPTVGGFVTARPVEFAACLWSRFDPAFIVPKGTRAVFVPGADGIEGGKYAVADVPLLKRLTGNSHDPVYRFAWLPADAVAKESRHAV